MDSMNEVFMANDPMHAEIMEEYYRKKKSVGTAYFFWFCFGLHYVYLNSPIKFIFYFLQPDYLDYGHCWIYLG